MMHTVQPFRTGIPGIEAFSLASTRQFPRHSHDQFGIGLIASGAHRSWSGFGWVDARAGDIIMVNPGEMHDGSSPDSNSRRWQMIYFAPEVISELFDGDVDVKAAVLLPRIRDSRQAIRFSRLFGALTERCPDPGHSEECLLHTAVHAFRHHSTQRSWKQVLPPSIDKVKKQIDLSPQLPHSLQEMATLANTSRFQFLRAFAYATGATPHAYILQRRVRLARRLIASGKELVLVSCEAGFADQSHMTRAFVRQLGVTPSRYRAAVCTNRSHAISFKTRFGQ
ncbi:MAG: AraC family transcriptional regulator [Acidobacteria bacterium]|nr:AraC family transcriptional regulator [Acidobacteriota bacterium]